MCASLGLRIGGRARRASRRAVRLGGVMRRSTRRYAWLSGLAAMFAVQACLTTLSFVGEPSQVAARRWAARLDHEHLQALTVEVNLRSRSSEEQRAAVAFMTPEQRSA